jgi:hypothetical protein
VLSRYDLPETLPDKPSENTTTVANSFRIDRVRKSRNRVWLAETPPEEALMGKMDEMKDKAKEMAGQHGDKIDQGMDKAGDMAKEKAPDQHDDKIDKGVDRGKQAAEDFGG